MNKIATVFLLAFENTLNKQANIYKLSADSAGAKAERETVVKTKRLMPSSDLDQNAADIKAQNKLLGPAMRGRHKDPRSLSLAIFSNKLKRSAKAKQKAFDSAGWLSKAKKFLTMNDNPYIAKRKAKAAVSLTRNVNQRIETNKN